MLYVFWVEKGSIVTLNIDVAVNTVANLKSVLAQERCTNIAEANQVLLISGGECLQDDKSVAQYQSGTDTNPIFLFNGSAIEEDHGIEFSGDSLPRVPDEREAKESIENILSLPSGLNSIAARTQLAQQYHEHAKEINRQCTALVQEQHLQHQGWQAVMANLDDVTAAFLKRLELFKSAFQLYLNSRQENLEKLVRFGDSVDILGKIPLFPSLIRPGGVNLARLESPGDGTSSSLVKSPTSPLGAVQSPDDNTGREDVFDRPDEELTILDWISARDAEHSLNSVAEGCRRTMETFDDDTLEEVETESTAVVKQCDDERMKEIKGLAERLYGLDQLLNEAKKLVVEQKENAELLYKLQTQATAAGAGNSPQSAAGLFGTSPSARDVQMSSSALYSGPFNQLLKCHAKLCDIRNRCLKAKKELCGNLHVRLQWVVLVEKNIMEVDDKIRIYYENIRRIRRLHRILDQVSTAPQVFAVAVQEVLRRRRYARDFLHWANGVSEKAVESYTKETDARRTFLRRFGSHFLLSLFPGLDQYPPPFADTPPPQFDGLLPSISPGEVTQLRHTLPELDQYFRLDNDGSTDSLSPLSPGFSGTEKLQRRVSFVAASPSSHAETQTGVLSDLTLKSLQSSVLSLRSCYENLLMDLSLLPETAKANQEIWRKTFEEFVEEEKRQRDEAEKEMALCVQRERIAVERAENEELYGKQREARVKELEKMLEEKQAAEEKASAKLRYLEDRLADAKSKLVALLPVPAESDDLSAVISAVSDRLKLIQEAKPVIPEQASVSHDAQSSAYLLITQENLDLLIEQRQEETTKLWQKKLSQREQVVSDDLHDLHLQLESQRQKYVRLQGDLETSERTVEEKLKEMEDKHRNAVLKVEREHEALLAEKTEEWLGNMKAVEKQARLNAEELEVTKREKDQELKDLKSLHTRRTNELQSTRDLDFALLEEQAATNLQNLMNQKDEEMSVLKEKLDASMLENQTLSVLTRGSGVAKEQGDTAGTGNDAERRSATSARQELFGESVGSTEKDLPLLRTESLATVDMTESVIGLPSSADIQLSTGALGNISSSPALFASQIQPHQPRFSIGGGQLPGQQAFISLSTCNVGDLILFVFNKDFKQFAAYLPFKRSLYLLHSDSHTQLSLSVAEPDVNRPSQPSTEPPFRYWIVAEVAGKEYVLTKKVPNRYRLAIGTKFYRVRAKAWSVDPQENVPGSSQNPSTGPLSPRSAPRVEPNSEPKSEP